MDKKDIASQAEKYKREMMRLYGKSTSPAAEETVPAVNTRPETEEFPDAVNEPERDIETEPDTEDVNPDDKTLDERYPEPDLSELSEDFGQTGGETPETEPSYASEESLGGSKGFILVNVRTGDESEPIENASVKVTAIVGGERMLIASGITNQSGTAPRFEVPVPDVSLSQSPDSSVRPYTLYDISVTAKGFFNSRSVDVPVFPGITSVQTFSMIPVPIYMSPNEETVTYFNQEPRL